MGFSFPAWWKYTQGAARLAARLAAPVPRGHKRGAALLALSGQRREGNIGALLQAHRDPLHRWGEMMPPLPAVTRTETALCPHGGRGWGQEEHVKQTDGYTASPVITGINWVNHRLSSCSPCGRRGSDTVIEN